MKTFLPILAASLLAWSAALAPAAQVPLPAIVRVITVDRDGTSMGSGALVAADAYHGLVVTNWHVVRDAAGPITVVFPDGFRGGAIVLKVDRDWDLAALAIQKPKALPLPVATEAPRPGEPLTIAGYGPDGVYRAVTGHCTEYLSPRENLPAELVEVDVQARHGDSGGPILNSRGEIAGVLFGAGGNLLTGGYTMGSYCGRARQFLAASYVAFQKLPSPGQGAGGAEQGVAGSPAVNALKPSAPPLAPGEAAASPQIVASLPPPPLARDAPVGSPAAHSQAANSYAASPQPQVAAVADGRPPSASSVQTSQGSPIAQVSPAKAAVANELVSPMEQIKTVLAIIGIIAILFHGLRIVGSAAG